MRRGSGPHQAEIGNPADGDQRGEAAGGEAEHADPVRLDLAMLRPLGQHVVDQAVDLCGVGPDLHRLALVVVVVPGVGHRRHHEAGARQGEGGVVVLAVPAARAVRHHDQRQGLARGRRASATVWVKARSG